MQADRAVAIITGGSGTLGSAIAHGLGSQGLNIAILGRNRDKAARVVRELEADGIEALEISADVLDRTQLDAARQKVIDRWGRIDHLINCAGGNMPGAVVRPDQSIFDISIPDLERVTSLNLTGTVLPSMVFASDMVKGGKGNIINISSVAANLPLTRVLGYSAAKAGIDNFTRWLAVEMANKYGETFRVNAVAPGFFIADQNRDLLLNSDGSLTGRGEKIINNTPMRRFGKPEELQGAINWLCSDQAAFVTGTVIYVDGGFTAFSGV